MMIGKSKFKAYCLQLIDDVHRTREEVIIVEGGKPIAKLVPFSEEVLSPIVGLLRDTIEIKEDIVGPVEVKWNAEVRPNGSS